MKWSLIIFYFLIGTLNSTIAQNDRNVLNYIVTENGKPAYTLTLTITSISDKGINLHWISPFSGEGNILMSSSAWRDGVRGFWKQPISGSSIRLENDQTIASFSQKFYQEIKKVGRAKYDGIEYVANSKKQKLIVGEQLANTVPLESTDKHIRAWMLDNPQIPLIIKMTGHPSGIGFELFDLSTFFFWKEREDFRYLPIPSGYLLMKSFDSNKLRKKGRYTDAVNFLPNNYVKDGSEDYTTFLQNCLNSAKYILMPDFPVLINDTGLSIKSNTTIFFQKNSKLLLKPSNLEHYGILKIHNARNVAVLNGNLVGDRETHIGKEGEWGMGISILSSKNVIVKNIKVSNCWGDGIYVGRLLKLSSNVQIKECYIDNNRRNGLSIIGGKRLIIEDCVFSNTNGTDPQCGIDIEPNGPDDLLKRIKLRNNITFNNKHSGVLTYLNASPSFKKSKRVTISISNGFDDNSLNPLRISGYLLHEGREVLPLRGYIEIKRMESKNNNPCIINKNNFFPAIFFRK